MTSPEVLYLAQLIDRPASETRRTALPTEAFEHGTWRTVYRAIVAASHDHGLVTVEAVCSELAEAGKLHEVGGRGVVSALVEHSGAHLIDGARTELVAHATQRVLTESSYAVRIAASEGRARDAVEHMQAAQRLVGALQGAASATVLKSVRDHIQAYVAAAASPATRPPQMSLGALSKTCGDLQPGTMGLIYGFSQSGKSWMMQYLERAYATAGYPTLRVSCEDPDTVNAGRLVSEVCNIDASAPHDLRREDWQRIMAATGQDNEHWDRRYVVEHSASIEAIVQTIRAASSSVGIRVAFVDYAQILRAASARATDTQETRLTENTSLLKEACKEVGVQLWLGSQVTVRDPKPGKTYKPTPFDLKGARSLYEMAEQGLALWVNVGSGERFVEVQKDKIKGRAGDTGRIEVGRGGVIREIHPCTPPSEQTKPGVGYGSDYHDE